MRMNQCHNRRTGRWGWRKRWREGDGEIKRERERGGKKRESDAIWNIRTPSTFLLSLLQDSWQSQRGRAERGTEEKELKGGEGAEGGVWRLGEELAANFAISEKQNAEGKWGSRGGKAEEQEICSGVPLREGEPQVELSDYILRLILSDRCVRTCKPCMFIIMIIKQFHFNFVTVAIYLISK